uniref:Putative retrovirus-related pol polyprotein from transposon tnt n=1 Tax=Corethrella appendiculata TaxID=1370023 RepID=W4VRQ4_9DIPT
MSVNVNGVTVEKLRGRDNYNTWKISIKALLQLDDLWSETIENEELITSADADKERKAQAKLILSIDSVCYPHIEGATSAKLIWKRLADAYDDNGLTRRVGLLRKLITTTLSGCASMDIYVNQIISTAHTLNGIGCKLDDEWVGTMLLAGLPEYYKPMIMGLESSGLKITGDLVKSKLLQEIPVAPSETAFAANRTRGTGSENLENRHRGDNFRSKKSIRCSKCNKFGHIARKCFSNRKNFDSGGSSKSGNLFCAVSAATNCGWYIDSAATTHLAGDSNLLINKRASAGSVMAADGVKMEISEAGSTEIKSNCSSEIITVENVNCIPELAVNLLSVSEIVKKGNTVIFKNQGAEIYNPKDELILTAHHSDGLFKVEQSCQSAHFTDGSNISSYELWHRRMGHINRNSLEALRNNLADGITFSNQRSPDDCKTCSLGKQFRLKFNNSGSRAGEILEIVHSDICGPMETMSFGGNRYFLTFIDDKSRKIFVYFLKTKSQWEVCEKFQHFLNMAERQSGQQLKILRTDNGSEYVNHKFQEILSQKGIVHQKTNVYTPQQNGMAERNNRSIVEKARCMLADANLPKPFWAEAVNYSVYLLNRSPSSGTNKTPHEAWSGKKPNLQHIRIFGTTVMALIPKELRRKLDFKSKEGKLLGYDEHTKGYRIYDIVKKEVFISRDVKFINEGGKTIDDPNFESQVVEIPIDDVPIDIGPDNCVSESSIPRYVGIRQLQQSSSPSLLSPTSPALPEQIQTGPSSSEPSLRRSKRERRPPGKYDQYLVESSNLPSFKHLQVNRNSNSTCSNIGVNASGGQPVQFNNSTDNNGVQHDTAHSSILAPRSYQNGPVVIKQQGFKYNDLGRVPLGKYRDINFNKNFDTGVDFFNVADPETPEEALSRPDGNRWKMAMEEEYQSLLANDTWELEDLPENRKPIQCKWVFKTKRDATGAVDRYKALLVIKGYSQRKGVDYAETYSPVVRHSSLRYLFALAAKHNLQVHQMDAVTAFLQGDLSEEIYMRQPPMYSTDNSKCCRLKKALYGLKQASRVWNRKLDEKLKSLGFQQSTYDTCVYFKIEGNRILIIAIYVDDMMLFSNCLNWLKEIKEKLGREFRMKDMGKAKFCLGIKITETKSCITLDQQHYIEEILNKFGMSECKPSYTPMQHNQKLSKADSPNLPAEIEDMKQVPYQEAIGCLMYLSNCTRPDISFVVNKLSRFNNNPGTEHWAAVKHLFRYLRGTSSYNLTYNRGSNSASEVVAYCDADWASDLDDRKSTSGFVLLAQGGAISWRSNKQSTVSLSSCEAEYMALSNLVQEVVWWNGFINQLNINSNSHITIYCDNQSTIFLAGNKGYNPRTKHIDIRHHFIQDMLQQKLFQLKYIPTSNQVADGLTKALDKNKLINFREAMGIKNVLRD